jgi:hypothetical protein
VPSLLDSAIRRGFTLAMAVMERATTDGRSTRRGFAGPDAKRARPGAPVIFVGLAIRTAFTRRGDAACA